VIWLCTGVRRAYAAGTLPCPANARVVPVRPTGGSAGGLPGRAGDAGRWAWCRPGGGRQRPP